MKFTLWLLVVLVTTCLVEGKKKSADSDFEFVNEDAKSELQRKTSMSEKKKWIHDPSNDLCKPLNCKKKELCLLEDAYTAVCVSKQELHKNKDEVVMKNKYLEEEAQRNAEAEARSKVSEDSDSDDDIFYDSAAELKEDTCKPCPINKPMFLCGSDNKTYSSLCRLDYHNCLHDIQIKVSCEGFCPCREIPPEIKKAQRKSSRLNQLKTKYKKTVEDNDELVINKKKDEAKRQSNRATAKYTFTPEDIKYDNKHYKYIKFTANDADEVSDKRSETNEVFIKEQHHDSYKQFECKGQQLKAIGNRLLDWFSVIMSDNKKRRQQNQKSKARFPSSCKPEVQWMFGHLDMNADAYLSSKELYDLEHDKEEKCIRPFIEKCDLNEDLVLSVSEWCRCFEKSDRPCAAVRRRLIGDVNGNYAPDCDDDGFYKPTQCHSVGVCWCVDKHGVEFANTRTRDKPKCDEINMNASSTGVRTSDDEDDVSDNDESAEEGSADRLLSF